MRMSTWNSKHGSVFFVTSYKIPTQKGDHSCKCTELSLNNEMRELSSVQLSMFTRKTGYTPFRWALAGVIIVSYAPSIPLVCCSQSPGQPRYVLCYWVMCCVIELCVVLLGYVLFCWVMGCFVGLCVVLLSYVLFCWVQTQFSLGRHKQNRFRNDISENGALNYCYGVTCWLLSIRSLWCDTYTTEKHAYKYTTVSLLSDKHLNHFNYIINKIIRWSHSTWITLLLTGR